MSTLSGWGSWSSCPSLLALSREGSVAGSSAGTCTKGLVLRYGPLNSCGRRRTQALKHWSPSLVLLGWGSRFRACLVALLGLLNKGNWRAHHPICLPMARTRFCRTLGSGPRTWGPLKGAVLTVLRTCGWKPKFLSSASHHIGGCCESCRYCRNLSFLCDSLLLVQ